MRIGKLFALTSALTAFFLLLVACAPGVAPAREAARTPESKLTASSPTPKPPDGQLRRGGILTRANYEDPPSFDVQQEQTAPASLVLFNIYQGLVRLDPIEHDKIIPELAEKWEGSADGTSYTFKFAKGIKWHDGKPFSSDDVKYSLERMQNPQSFKIISPRGQGLLAAMDRAELVGDDGIKVKLKYPSASFLLNIATGWVAVEPKHILVAKGDMKKDAVGTGPFKLKDYVPNISLQLVKNPEHHIKGVPYIDGIKFYTVKDDASRFAAFRTGQVKMTASGTKSMTPVQAEIVKRDMAGAAVVYEHSGMVRYGLIINLGKKPWDDVRVRKAVDLAFDRQAALKVNGKGVAGSTFDPQSSWGMKESDVIKLPGYRQPKDEDVTAAKKLLDEAGLSTGFKTKLTSPAGGAQEQQAVVAKDQLAKLGIIADLETVESAVLNTRLKQHNFDVVSYSFSDSTGDPDETLSSYYASGSSQNYGNFNDKEVDQLIDRQARLIDEKGRRAVLAEIDKRVMELVPRVITLWDMRQTGAWAEIKDFSPGPGIHPWGKLDKVWLAK